jgi:hypothetical protein
MESSNSDKLSAGGVRVELLELHPNFIQFVPEELAGFKEYCVEKNIKKGEILFNENEDGKAMYVVRKGSIKISKIGFLGEIVIAAVNPGEFAGEMAVIDGSPRSAAAIAAVDTELYELSLERFDLMKKEKPGIAIKIMGILLKLLSIRLRATTLKMLKKGIS